jgi:Ca2+-binding EF-hand superfamily protein
MRDPKLGLGNVETSEIDGLFKSFDQDQGGSLDLEELRAALKRLRKEAATASSREAEAEAMAEHWRMRAKEVTQAMVATDALEAAHQRLLQIRVMLGKEGPATPSELVTGAVDARLYTAMVQRNLKIGDLVSKWDVNNDGLLSRQEFVSNVLKLVPNAVQTEVDDLFDQLDEDGGGELDLAELKHALKSLQDAAARAATEETSQASELGRLRKEVRRLQEAVLAAKVDDEAHFNARAEKAKLAEEAKLAAEVEARAAKARARAERAERAKKEKAEFDARVESKRLSARGSKVMLEGLGSAPTPREGTEDLEA